jgi:hypothetical protein
VTLTAVCGQCLKRYPDDVPHTTIHGRYERCAWCGRLGDIYVREPPAKA